MKRKCGRRGAVALAWAVAGCATQGGEGGGAANLPNRGIVPYEKVELGDAGVPIVLAPPDDDTRVGGASAVVDGGRVVLYVELGGSVARAESADGVVFGAPETVLSAGAAIGSPAVARAGDAWHLVYVRDGGRAIGYARSADGRRFEAEAAPLLVAEGEDEAGGLDGPSLVPVDGGFRLYYAARADADSPFRVAWAESGPDLRFERRGVALEPGAGCVDFLGKTVTCWDADGVESPEVRRARTPTGRTVWRMFYTGRRGGKTGLGFAASFDGVAWSRYAHNPVLDDAGSEREPSNVLLGGRYLLYFVQGRRPPAIGAAVSAAGRPADTW